MILMGARFLTVLLSFSVSPSRAALCWIAGFVLVVAMAAVGAVSVSLNRFAVGCVFDAGVAALAYAILQRRDESLSPSRLSPSLFTQQD